MAGDAGGRGALLESMLCALTRGSRATCVKQGKITVPTRVAHALGFRPPDLVAVVKGS